MPANDKFLEMASRVIAKKLPKIGAQPAPVFEEVSEAEASAAIVSYDAKPRHRSELARRLSMLEIGAGLRTTTPKKSIVGTVNNFAKQAGWRFRVFEHESYTWIIRLPNRP